VERGVHSQRKSGGYLEPSRIFAQMELRLGWNCNCNHEGEAGGRVSAAFLGSWGVSLACARLKLLFLLCFQGDSVHMYSLLNFYRYHFLLVCRSKQY
jgi:hypothetical protein